MLRGGELMDSFMFAIALAVAAIPEAQLYRYYCAFFRHTENVKGKRYHKKASGS